MNLYSFNADYQDLCDNIESYVDIVFSSLTSDFLIMPKGNGFIDYPAFEEGYEKLKETSKGFIILDPINIYKLTMEYPMIFIVLRTMLGFTPPEWAYIASGHCSIVITQNQMPNPFKLVQRSGFIRPKNPVASDQEILCHPGKSPAPFKKYKCRKIFCQEK